MELLKKETKWFLSQEGAERFSALSSLEERIIFIYSYLKGVVNENFDKNHMLFKMAFFFADAVYNSNEEYAKYPQILQKEHNPFMAYLMNESTRQNDKKTYLILTSILHQKADASKKTEWIYDKSILGSKEYLEKLSKKGIEFLPIHSMNMVEPAIYEMDDSIKFLQLELVWLFLKSSMEEQA